jgi:hypothetical protein
VNESGVRSGGTRIAEAITIGLLQTQLDGAVTFPADSSQTEAYRVLVAHNFDQAPVLEDDVPVGFVLRDDLGDSESSLTDCIRPILPSSLVSADAPLERVLPWLASEEFLFVLSGRDITGFVVAADLNKQAGRAFFFLLVLELELLLADALRSEAEDQLALMRKLGGRGEQIIKRHARLRDQNVESDLISVATLTDLFALAGRTTGLCDSLGIRDEASWAIEWTPVRDVRNAVAHPTSPLLSTRHDIQKVVTAEQHAREMISRLDRTRQRQS